MPLDPNWIAGFVQADGTFGLNYTKQVRMRLGYTCQPQFRVCQHERDLSGGRFKHNYCDNGLWNSCVRSTNWG
jgi:hypothetical protein